MNEYEELDKLMAMFVAPSQADALYTASIKTFWPGYEARVGYDNRLEKIDTDFTPDFAGLADQTAEVRRIQRSDYAKKHWPKFYAGPDVSVVATPIATRFDAWTSGEVNRALGAGRGVTLHLPQGAWGRSRAVLLHELAHAVDRYEYAATDRGHTAFDDGHGATFARLNIEMVRAFYSPEMADKLAANFKAEKVRVEA
jgi:hypothetical protein